MCVFLILIAGLRYGVGGDTLQYMEDWKWLYNGHLNHLDSQIRNSFRGYGYMPLWVIFNAVLKHISNEFWLFQLVQAAIVNISICWLVKRYSHRLFTFLLIYFLSGFFFLLNTEVMREGLAIAFALPGIELLMNKHYGRALLLIAIGMLFHLSALIYVLFILTIIRAPLTRRTLWISCAIAFSIWIGSTLLVRFAMPVLNLLPGKLSIRITAYTMMNTNLFGFLRYLITYLILPYIVGYYNVKWEEDPEMKERKSRMVRWIMMLGLIACSMAGFMRLANHMQIFYLLLLTDFIYMLLRKKEHLIIRMGTTVGIVIVFGWWYMTYWPKVNAHLYEFYFPYSSVVDENYSLERRKAIHQVSSAPVDKSNNEGVRSL